MDGSKVNFRNPTTVVEPVIKLVKCSERLPAKTGIYPAFSTNSDRNLSTDWVDCLCHFDVLAGKGKSKWQHSSGFYDNGITHWGEVSYNMVVG